MNQFLESLNTSPVYDLIIPSTGKKAKYRAYTVAEEQKLLLTKESGDAEMIITNTKEIINTCMFGAVDPDKLASFDLEYIFLMLRSKSVGEEVEGVVACKTEGCKGKIDILINLKDVATPVPEKGANVIKLNEDVTVVMKYPGFDTLTLMTNASSNIISILASLIDAIVNKEDARSATEFSQADLEKFLKNMNSKTIKKITDFLEKIPILTHTVKGRCPICKTEHEYNFRGLKNFFS
jgi:hypothetical protein